MTSRPATTVVLTCEHGGNTVPAEYRHLFDEAADVLASHRGWDPGALDVARSLAGHLSVPLISSTTTRLLVELNRSPGHPQLFSRFTASLPDVERDRLIAEHYRPYRVRVEHTIAAAPPPVLHVSVHSFTDVLDGDVRELEIGVLYDPARGLETAVANVMLAALAEAEPDWRLARNAPYAGTDDGLTTHLRTLHGDVEYAGIEIELRQGLLADTSTKARAITALTRALQHATKPTP